MIDDRHVPDIPDQDAVRLDLLQPPDAILRGQKVRGYAGVSGPTTVQPFTIHVVADEAVAVEADVLVAVVLQGRVGGFDQPEGCRQLKSRSDASGIPLPK